MIFLEQNFAGDLPAWIQVGFGMATLIIAITAMFQSKQIKELTEVTNELRNQTQILNKRYELEANIALNNQIPNFRIASVEPASGSWLAEPTGVWHLIIILVNMGAAAHNISYENIQENAEVRIVSRPIVDTKSLIEVSFHGGQKFLKIMVEEIERSFTLIYKDAYGRALRQDITLNYKTRAWEISFPKLSES